METPTTTPTRSVRYECLCQKCGEQFELPNEAAPHFCPACAPAVIDAAKAAVAHARDYIDRIKIGDIKIGFIIVRAGEVFGWFRSGWTSGPHIIGAHMVPMAGGDVLVSVGASAFFWVNTGYTVAPADRIAQSEQSADTEKQRDFRICDSCGGKLPVEAHELPQPLRTDGRGEQLVASETAAGPRLQPPHLHQPVQNGGVAVPINIDIREFHRITLARKGRPIKPAIH